MKKQTATEILEGGTSQSKVCVGSSVRNRVVGRKVAKIMEAAAEI
jgi:hypothetical protein